MKIFSPDFLLLAQIDDYESLIFTRRYHKAGDFQVVINFNKNDTQHLKRDNIIYLSARKCGIITHKEIQITEQGEEVIKVIGHTLSGITKDRVTVPPSGAYDRVNSNAETIIKTFVDNNLITTDADRIYPNLELAPNQNRGDTYNVQTRLKNLEEVLEKISLLSGVGWEINFDTDKFIFDVYEGLDRTANNGVNNPVIFSTEYDNIKEQKYIDSVKDAKTVGYVGGQGEGEDRLIVEVGTATGRDRKEVFIDARDIGGTEDPPPTQEEIEARLIARGNQNLSELRPIQSFESQILTYSNFVYEVDYDLGDLVTVQSKKWGLTLNTRITEITEIYERDGFNIDAVFGDSIPTIQDKIKQRLDNPVV